MFKLSGVYQNIITAVLFCGTVFYPRLMASTCVELKSPAYTVQYHPLCVEALSRVILLPYYGPVPPPPRLMYVQDVKSLV